MNAPTPETLDRAATAFLNILTAARRRVAKDVDRQFDLAKVEKRELRTATRESRWGDLNAFMMAGLELCKSGQDLAEFYRGGDCAAALARESRT